ncbi:MAG TPA: Qat anti-phage system associated protein QatB [Pyrinomonadaceae bacterium]|nr:Qat anti-phage system associated protein QatB [Pyrinomonadaceae bacterium]
MGTSSSSGGPPSGVPMVPPWVPDIPSDETPGAGLPQAPAPTPSPTPTIAPPNRFGGARRNLGDFARSGDANSLRRGVGSYVRSGYGGAGTAVRRFGGAVSTAGMLYDALALDAADQPVTAGTRIDPVLLRGKTAREVMDAVIEAVQPVDGTQDAEAGRAAIGDALSELLTRFPEADLLNLNDEERMFAVERYVAFDVFRRFDLDLGKTIRDKAPSAATALSRLKQVRDYIKETVAAAFRRLRQAATGVTSRRMEHLVRDALRAAFDVFEAYAS